MRRVYVNTMDRDTQASGKGQTMTAQNLIDQSVAQNEIVDADWDAEIAADLLAACDDSVDCNGVSEFWGEEGGNDWRVHLNRAE